VDTPKPACRACQKIAGRKVTCTGRFYRRYGHVCRWPRSRRNMRQRRRVQGSIGPRVAATEALAIGHVCGSVWREVACLTSSSRGPRWFVAREIPVARFDQGDAAAGMGAQPRPSERIKTKTGRFGGGVYRPRPAKSEHQGGGVHRSGTGSKPAGSGLSGSIRLC
jgi:hypothetical protein